MNASIPRPVSEFLASLRARMRHIEPRTLLPAEPTSLLREVGPDDDVVARFLDSAAAVGCRVYRSTDQDWLAAIREIVRGQAAKKVIIEPQAGTALTAERTAALHQALATDGVATTEQRDDETLFAADVAITGVLSAIAETGTLVCASGPASARGASLIPPVHIALVAESQLVADLFDAFAAEKVSGTFFAGSPANISLITGPSKTADIEGVLVTGVHGPGEVHVVLV
jgi:L-lactate dehydrogenase complex protein LldG